MKVVIIADTHFALMKKIIDIPDGDMLIHCGDLDVYNKDHFVIFRKWMKSLPHKYKVIIPGNHDVFWKGHQNGVINYKDFYLLLHDKVEIEGVKIFGSPYTLKFQNWTFMYDKEHSHKIWSDVPNDIDILVSHGPPYRILDEVTSGPTAGSHG
jgi:predicted phosphodiesterase